MIFLVTENLISCVNFLTLIHIVYRFKLMSIPHVIFFVKIINICPLIMIIDFHRTIILPQS